MRKTLSVLPLLCIILSSLISCSKEDVFRKVTASKENENGVLARPNVIIILADDIGYEIPTYTGGESYSTPNLNYLAANGTQFTQAHTAPLCFPSRIMLLTGKYNFRNYTTWGVLDPKNKTIANLAKRAGYATCMAGKWQCDGGGASVKAFGFDKYLITNPYEFDSKDSGAIRYYKDPDIFENGTYWAASKTKGRYGENIIRDYMFKFIDSVKSIKPFFIYWAPNLVHGPFCPTPDDPQFATWNSEQAKKTGDTIYFRSMVKYHDKLIGQLRQKLVNAGIANNTIIIWAGDNGTDAGIHSKWNGQIVNGSKSSSKGGTHVPMLAYCPGRVKSGFIDTSLISLVDFMPTVADLMQTTIPVGYGKQDGISFAPQFSGDFSNVRPWIFCHFRGAGANENDPEKLRRWMQGPTYKQYDSLPNLAFSKRFYNIKLDPAEKNPIAPINMTLKEKIISKKYLDNMKTLR